MIHIDLQVLGNFIEPVSCGILGICHDSDHLTNLAFKIHPNGYHGVASLGFFPLSGDIHEEVGDFHESGWMLEQFAIVCITFYIGQTHVVSND